MWELLLLGGNRSAPHPSPLYEALIVVAGCGLAHLCVCVCISCSLTRPAMLERLVEMVCIEPEEDVADKVKFK